MIEVEDLLAKMKILEKRWPPLADCQGVLIIGNRHALLGRQDIVTILRNLMQFAA